MQTTLDQQYGETATQRRPDDAPESAPAAEPRRRCVVTRASHPKGGLLRFVVAPDGTLVPDPAEKLPGRGLYVTPDRALLETAIAKRLFAKAARQPVRVSEDLPEQVGRLLRQRALDLVGFANRAGQAVAGFDRVRAWLDQGRAAVVVMAADGAPGPKARLSGLARAIAEDGPLPGQPAAGPKLAEALDQDGLGAAFGRASAVFVAVAPGGLARQLAVALDRIESYETAAAGKKTAAKGRKAR
jgi:hypothetical protein